MRSCTEFDGDWLRLLGEIHGKPVIPAGFLPPPLDHEETGKAATVAAPTSSDAALFEWLDGQAPRSVLYVAMGSEAVLSVNLLHELALGLELSRLTFLWALRRPAGLPPDVSLLPEGFESRTTGKGIVAKGWVPQPEILAHRSVGGFLTHTGWSSLVEGFRHGLPMVMLPVFVDQGLTARLTGKRGLGVEVPRSEEDGAFTREGVAETIRRVVVDEAGEEVRTAARRAAALFGDRRLQEEYETELAKFFSERSRPAGAGRQPVDG